MNTDPPLPSAARGNVRTPRGVEAAYQLRELRNEMNAVLARIDKLERAGEADADRDVREGARLARLDAAALAHRFTSMRQSLAQRVFFAGTRKDAG